MKALHMIIPPCAHLFQMPTAQGMPLSTTVCSISCPTFVLISALAKVCPGAVQSCEDRSSESRLRTHTRMGVCTDIRCVSCVLSVACVLGAACVCMCACMCGSYFLSCVGCCCCCVGGQLRWQWGRCLWNTLSGCTNPGAQTVQCSLYTR